MNFGFVLLLVATMVNNQSRQRIKLLMKSVHSIRPLLTHY